MNGGSIAAPAEVGRRTAWVAAAVASMTAAFVLAKTGRDGLYFTGGGLYDLPRAYIGIAILALPVAGMALATMKLLGPRRARVVAPIVFAAALGAYAIVARPGGGSLMTACFMIVPLAFGVLFSMAWLLAADLLEGASRDQLARAYATIGGASIFGGMSGGLVARVLAMRFEPPLLLAVAALVLLASAVLMAAAQRRYPRRPWRGGRARVLPEAVRVRGVVRQPYTLLLVVVAMLAALVGVLVEFQFYVAAGTSGRSGQANARFFADAYLILNAAAFGVQLWILPRVQKAIGLAGLLLVLPAMLLGSGVLLLVNASMGVRAFLRIAEGGLKSSVHRTGWEQAYLPLAPEARPVAKLIVDGAAARLAEGAAAVGLFAWLRWSVGQAPLVGQSIAWVTWALLGAVIAWFAMVQMLGRRLRAAVALEGGEDCLRPDVMLPDT